MMIANQGRTITGILLRMSHSPGGVFVKCVLMTRAQGHHRACARLTMVSRSRACLCVCKTEVSPGAPYWGLKVLPIHSVSRPNHCSWEPSSVEGTASATAKYRSEKRDPALRVHEVLIIFSCVRILSVKKQNKHRKQAPPEYPLSSSKGLSFHALRLLRAGEASCLRGHPRTPLFHFFSPLQIISKVKRKMFLLTCKTEFFFLISAFHLQHFFP